MTLCKMNIWQNVISIIFVHCFGMRSSISKNQLANQPKDWLTSLINVLVFLYFNIQHQWTAGVLTLKTSSVMQI